MYENYRQTVSAYPYIRVSTYRTCTIKPIALYGCEIWGTFNSNTARFRNGTVSPDRIYSNLIGEKLHTKFCKFILGVHRKPTNFAVLSELGRFPLYYDIIKSIFHYWNRLEYLEKFPLLQNAYEQSKQIYNQNKSSWYGSLQRILQNFPTISQLKERKFQKTASIDKSKRAFWNYGKIR